MNARLFSFVFIFFKIIVVDIFFWQWHYVHMYICCIVKSQITITSMQLRVFFILQQMIKYLVKSKIASTIGPDQETSILALSGIFLSLLPKLHVCSGDWALTCGPIFADSLIVSNLSFKFLGKVSDNLYANCFIQYVKFCLSWGKSHRY